MKPISVKRIPEFELKYEAQSHHELPHVVKFSGGRSSGLMLFLLLESGALDADRGDVIVFNNTSTEHPRTYDFTMQCKTLVEEEYGIPFFWIEFQTYEDARNGTWVRIPSYRLVQPKPLSEECPDGYLWRGEAYEELLSFTGFVPNLFHRTCTSHLKLETTRSFLKDWFSCQSRIERLGHYGKSSRLNQDEMYEHHLKNKGGVPKHIYLDKKAFVRSRPVSRPEQLYERFSKAYRLVDNKYLTEKRIGNRVLLGEDGVEYLAFVGLRSDEMRRVVKVRKRNSGGPHSVGYEGEHVYLPLSDVGVTSNDIEEFWNKQDWNLELDPEDGLSNCTYCFLKGLNGLRRVHSVLNTNLDQELANTPCDIRWWIDLEQKYGRNLKAENREVRNLEGGDFIGFFGNNRFTYETLSSAASNDTDLSDFEGSIMPCDCTD